MPGADSRDTRGAGDEITCTAPGEMDELPPAPAASPSASFFISAPFHYFFFFSGRCCSTLEADQTTPDARRVFSSVTRLQEDRMLAPFPGQQGREAGSTPSCAKGQKGTGPTRGTGWCRGVDIAPWSWPAPKSTLLVCRRYFFLGCQSPSKKSLGCQQLATVCFHGFLTGDKKSTLCSSQISESHQVWADISHCPCWRWDPAVITDHLKTFA